MSTQPDTVRALPHAPGVEKDVLSVMFQDPAMIDEAPGLKAEHFHLPGHRLVFDLIRELHSTGKPVELVSFVQTLIDRGLLERAGGPAAIAEFQLRANLQPDVFTHQIGILTEKLARRMTIAAAHEMERVAYEAAEQSEIIEVTSAPISAIHDTLTGTGPATSTKSVLLGCFDRFEKLCTGQADPMGIETSLFEINNRFRGLHPAQTIVVSAYPGGGKTALAGQFAMDAATSGHNTLFISLEVSAQTIMNRMLAYVARRPGDAITDPLRYCREVLQSNGPTNDMLAAIKAAARTISESPFHIESMNGANVYQIASCIRRAHRKNPLKLVVTDFAQRIRPAPENLRATKEQQLSHASNYLSDLSRELNFALVLPSQLNKEGASKHAEAINEDADLHLQIIQDRSGPAPSFAHVGIAVVKDRHHGQDGALMHIVLDGSMVRFIPKPYMP